MRLKRRNEMSKDITRAVLRYPGAKWRIADFILQHMPKHHSYLEPFFWERCSFVSQGACAY